MTDKPDGARPIEDRQGAIDSGIGFDLHTAIQGIIEKHDFDSYSTFQDRVIKHLETSGLLKSMVRAETPAENIIQILFNDGTILRMEFTAEGDIVVVSGYWSSAQRTVN